MDYNLAKQLKDAGWPQESGLVLYYAGHGEEGLCTPTLSELIEACKHFGGLRRLDLMCYEAYADSRKYEIWKVLGPTPEEAVAKLWLELNK